MNTEVSFSIWPLKPNASPFMGADFRCTELVKCYLNCPPPSIEATPLFNGMSGFTRGGLMYLIHYL